MRITRLHLQDFRGVREMDLELHAGVTVFVGKNGAGKSTLLDALALPLSDVFQQPPLWSGKPKQRLGAKNADVFHGKKSARIRIFLEPVETSKTADFDLTITQDAAVGVDEPAQVKLGKSARVEAMERELREDPNTAGSLLAIRYVPYRHVGPSSERLVPHDVLAPKSAYYSALDCGKKCRQFLTWFRKRQHNELLKFTVPWHEALDMLRKGERPPGADPHLFAARQAIAEFMGARALHYEENAFFVYKDGYPLSLRQLSDGERGLLGLVGDLTRRLSVTHPHLTDANRLLEKAEAVVMIDEAELHLHPSWQRSLVPQLRKTFPNVQFIITTHSPQVLGEIGSESLVLLEETRDGIEYRRFAKEVHGMSSGEILEALMGTPSRNLQVQEMMSGAYEAIERGNLETAKKLLADLISSSRDVPELERLSMRIRRREVVGR